LKLIDFGLAKILKEDDETTTFCGTPEYLAPEMVT
jgi:serine/threonine protein kinase